MKYFMMKRVLLAIALPVLVAYFGGSKVMSVYWVPLFFISSMLCATAFGKYVVKRNNSATLNYLNDNNDGIYFHKFNESEIRLDTNKQEVFLKNDEGAKTYSFEEIKEWSYNITYGGEVAGTGLSSIRENGKTLSQNIAETGLFIRVKDVSKPEWHIRFYPRNDAFNSSNGLNDLKTQLNQWMEIFDQNLNPA
ncbi:MULTISPECIES: DUF4755 domain-containing protein [Enterobacteriaceae]|uniref:DUF4755 domain-containing protein n=1 Tax=Enterobacteriaceae TaxID=543 RepID=UPI000A3864C6|nr:MULTISPECIES: DUF4755 domain-containing protein [Enterobacteriaceae]KAB7493048.1 DUF4755 domain-containing protein [Klebsiella michiganensis]MBG2664068.1 DUF4755 domain-containing protein [Klebsiella michiganensis]MBG2669250.1 DUF4755 domain-containing protein [Klebsiella michiganensis]MBG2676112.1 DUF4755 domain-containing protein [Klebsiella michiganensis]MBI0679278.1 DUF4755 domain-containing protein [Citrobacter koseri]